LNGEDEIFVIGEVKNKEFIGITPSNSRAILIKFLQENLIDKGKVIEAWSMDMSKLFKSACQEIAPQAPIVIDKYHVISLVNKTIDLCRVATEKSLNERFQIKRLLLMKTSTFDKLCKSEKPKWQYKTNFFKKVLIEHKEIRILWDLKNTVHIFYKCKKKTSIDKYWNRIFKLLKQHETIHPEFRELRKTLLNWEEEILNYFTIRITNAYIEGLNNRIETLKRKKFGFRNKERFLKSIAYALLPITIFIANTIFTH